MNTRAWIIGGSAAALAVAGTWWLAKGHSTQAPPASAQQGAHQGAQGGSVIALTSEQIAALGIKMAPVEPAVTMRIADLPAQILPPPNARVAVAAQFPGVITRIFVVNGQQVRAGQPLATVASRDMVSLTAELARAQSRRAVARAQAARLGQLAREGIIAPARSDEAAAVARQSDIDVSEQARLVGLAHGGTGGAGYTLSAPISGRISSMMAETGKAVMPETAPFVIDGGGPLQINAQLPERLIGKVLPGMKVRIGDVGEGTVIAAGGSIDPTTRSATITATLPAGAGVAGGSTSVAIEGPAPAGALRVPGNAIAEVGGRSVVFVATGKGVRVQPVTTAGIAGDSAIVTSGLTLGDRIVTNGVSELKMLAGAN